MLCKLLIFKGFLLFSCKSLILLAKSVFTGYMDAEGSCPQPISYARGLLS